VARYVPRKEIEAAVTAGLRELERVTKRAGRGMEWTAGRRGGASWAVWVSTAARRKRRRGGGRAGGEGGGRWAGTGQPVPYGGRHHREVETTGRW